jgi:hypothetical protein
MGGRGFTWFHVKMNDLTGRETRQPNSVSFIHILASLSCSLHWVYLILDPPSRGVAE